MTCDLETLGRRGARPVGMEGMLIRGNISGRIALFTWLALMLCGVPAHAEKRVALVIGNSRYEHTVRLPNPANDGAAIAGLLKSAGFNTVELKQDLGALELKRALREFTLTAHDADIAIIFFAGHGIEVGGVNYLVPVDAKLALDIDAEDEAVSLDRVLRALEPVKRLRLVILDACRDNPFARVMRRTVTTRAVGSGLAKVEPLTADTLIAFAAKAGSTAEDGGSVNSPFTSALLKFLAEPGLDLQLAFRKVRDEVLRSTRRKQEPYVYGSLGGDMISLVPPAPVVTVAPPPPMPHADEVTWSILKSSSDADAIRRFVDQFPASPLRAVAEERIATLTVLEKQRQTQAERERRENERAAKERADQVRRESEQRAREDADKRETERRAREESDRRDAQRREGNNPDAKRPEKPSTIDSAKPEGENRAGSTEPTAPVRPAEPGPGTQMAALPPEPTPTTADAGPPLTREALVQEIKKELRRAGCYSGSINGSWSDSEASGTLKKFAKYAGLDPQSAGLTKETLDAARRSPVRLCPLECSSRQVEKDGRCVAKTCPSGQRLGSDGKCTAVSADNTARRNTSPSPGRKCFVFNGKNYCE